MLPPPCFLKGEEVMPLQQGRGRNEGAHGKSIVKALPSRESFQLTNLVLSQGVFILYQKS